MTRYDIESFLADVKALLLSDLNSKLSAITSEKNDGITLKAVDASAYFLQSLNGTQVNHNPFIFYGVQDIATTGNHSYSSQKVDVVVAVVLEDAGQDVDIAPRLFRYGRALHEVIEEGFDRNTNGVKLMVQSLVPIDFKLMNSSTNHKAIGVLVQADLG